MQVHINNIRETVNKFLGIKFDVHIFNRNSELLSALLPFI